MTACTSLGLLFLLVFAGFSVCRLFFPEGWYSANAALIFRVHEQVAADEHCLQTDMHSDCGSQLEPCTQA